jgi:RNA methyltransferase, TrmH family
MLKIQPVTSAANPLVREVRRAIARGSLTTEGLCVAEGFHLLEEAVRSEREVWAILASESAAATVAERTSPRRSARTVVIADNLFQTIASTETSQGVISLVRPQEWMVEQLFSDTSSLIVILDGVQDPGNAGAIIRAAEAFGASGVMLLKGTVSPWNPKTLRASAGSLFRVPFVAGLEVSLALSALLRNNVRMFAAMPFTGSEPLAGDSDLARSCAIVIGGEGRGVSPELRAAARDVAIPTIAVESLNAAVAAAVLLYEARRQRALP